MSAQTEQPLVPNHVGFNDAETLLDAERTSSKSKDKSSTNTNKNERIEQVNIGNAPERRNSIVREVEVDDDGEVGEGQKAMREGKQVI
ncbi:hypothetical protein IFR05_002638 [Cadophora sp. M221]|nr:hypothetical protein IFR05_002638 [Cadophora sp. M221]